MPIRLLASLVLAVWAQQGEDTIPCPEAVRETRVTSIMIDAETRETRELTLEIYAQAQGNDRPLRPRRAWWPFDPETEVVARENFDRWLFGEPWEGGPRKHLEEIFLTRVRDATRERGLNAAQRDKLDLAGRGDIKRFLDQVEDRRRSFESRRRDSRTAFEVLLGLRPLSQVYRHGPFGDGSLFAKTLRRIEDERKAGR
jgi:hypothetical protein